MTATRLLRKLDIFVSSPSDVGLERNAVKWAIEFLNRVLFIAEGYLLFPLAYDELVPPEIGEPAQVIIDRYVNEPDQCYMLICILWTRMGTPFTHPTTNQTYQSGTEYEFLKAYEANRRAGKPLILLYRRQPGDADADAETKDFEQKDKVAAFFEKFDSSRGDLVGLYQEYPSVNVFTDLVVRNIADVIRHHPPEQPFRFSLVDRPEMVEEQRRLDAAMPSAAEVGRPTEVWVQLCVPDSTGFRGELPEERVSELDLSQKDIFEHALGVAFPLDHETGQTKSVVLSVEVVAPDFNVPIRQMSLDVVSGKDSARLLFSMVPRIERPKTIVHVHVKQTMPEGVEVVVGSAVLYAMIVAREVVSPVWSIIQRPLQSFQRMLLSVALLEDEQSTERDVTIRQEYQRMIGMSVPQRITELVAKLTWWRSWEKDPATAAALRELGERALPAYLQALRSDGKEWGAIRGLKELGDSVLPLLVAALEDLDPIMRRNAAYALGCVGGTRSVEPLIFALRDPDSRVRSAAAEALGHLGRDAGLRPVEPLTHMLNDENSIVRSMAARALGELGDDRAMPALISCLLDVDVGVRSHASNALYEFGDTAIKAIQAAGSEVIQALVSIAEADTIVFASNGWLLRAIGEPAVEPLIAALRRCQGQENWAYVRITDVLRSIGTPKALAALPPGT